MFDRCGFFCYIYRRLSRCGLSGLQQHTTVGVLWVILCWYLNIIGICNWENQYSAYNTTFTFVFRIYLFRIGDINFSNFSLFFNTGSMGSEAYWLQFQWPCWDMVQ